MRRHKHHICSRTHFAPHPPHVPTPTLSLPAWKPAAPCRPAPTLVVAAPDCSGALRVRPSLNRSPAAGRPVVAPRGASGPEPLGHGPWAPGPVRSAPEGEGTPPPVWRAPPSGLYQSRRPSTARSQPCCFALSHLVPPLRLDPRAAGCAASCTTLARCPHSPLGSWPPTHRRPLPGAWAASKSSPCVCAQLYHQSITLKHVGARACRSTDAPAAPRRHCGRAASSSTLDLAPHFAVCRCNVVKAVIRRTTGA